MLLVECSEVCRPSAGDGDRLDPISCYVTVSVASGEAMHDVYWPYLELSWLLERSEGNNLVSFLDVVESMDRKTALRALPDLRNVRLDVLEGVELA